MAQYQFEISDRFRLAVENRITQLEEDAAMDAKVIPELISEEHRERQKMLVAAQIDEAVRLRARLTFRGMVTVDSVFECLTER
jgi:uncharacterized coiled-coil protein SlyX